ncbi:MAG: FAD-dependent oxidoreductase [Maribacter sp.]|uniref:FAD-dependent oxidoreductase n=1 Tax=Maribacter sp. TaxID=1897614 RepID=UPI003C7939CD
MKQKLRRPITLLLCVASLSWCCTLKGQTYSADVIIYGGTSGAVIAAVEVAKSGKSVIVVSPDTHLGGLSAGGLGWSDTGNKNTIGGLSREFYHRVWKKYQDKEAWKLEDKSKFGNKGQGTTAMDSINGTMWIFEPHIAEQVYEELIEENGITVYRNEWLDRANGLVKENGNIESFETLSKKRFKGKIFIDATYEGDLMASAGISYHVGREANRVYDETWNGVQVGTLHHQHWFKSDISPYKIPSDPQSGLLPRISAEPPGAYGEGDDKIQAYCFRMCMTDHPKNRVPFPKPANYDPSQYELLARMFATGRRDWFSKFDMLPNRKTDTNNHGPFSSDNIGMNYDYPDATYERRKEIVQEHKEYQMGLLYFVANDPRVPDEIRLEMQKWGLAKDEFVDNDNWPHQIYVREARRMIGDYVTTEHDVASSVDTPRSVGMGSYAMDSHNAQRYVKPDGFVQNEGDIGTHVEKPYKISYGSLIPKKNECKNLLVPVCVSSSHIAFGSIRMEPVFMILGQSAAVAACMSIDQKIAVQDLNYEDLKKVLLQKRQVLEYDN